ncbi:MAG TPA: hypothetical protein VF313_05090 [Anaerolineaceae bacterium]|jgi:hypothetical protein
MAFQILKRFSGRRGSVDRDTGPASTGFEAAFSLIMYDITLIDPYNASIICICSENLFSEQILLTCLLPECIKELKEFINEQTR